MCLKVIIIVFLLQVLESRCNGHIPHLSTLSQQEREALWLLDDRNMQISNFLNFLHQDFILKHLETVEFHYKQGNFDGEFSLSPYQQRRIRRKCKSRNMLIRSKAEQIVKMLETCFSAPDSGMKTISLPLPSANIASMGGSDRSGQAVTFDTKRNTGTSVSTISGNETVESTKMESKLNFPGVSAERALPKSSLLPQETETLTPQATKDTQHGMDESCLPNEPAKNNQKESNYVFPNDERMTKAKSTILPSKDVKLTHKDSSSSTGMPPESPKVMPKTKKTSEYVAIAQVRLSPYYVSLYIWKVKRRSVYIFSVDICD